MFALLLKEQYNILGGMLIPNPPNKAMTRLIYFSLLLLLTALPLFAQEDTATNRPLPFDHPMLPGNQAVLMQMQQKLTRELQQVQQMLSVIPSTETQFINTLQTQQAELTRQIRDISQQLQASGMSPESAALPLGMMPPRSMPEPLPNVPRSPEPTWMPAPPTAGPAQPPVPAQPQPYTIMPAVPPQSPYTPGMIAPGMPTWNDPNPTWGNPPWGTNTSASTKELTEMKQSIESLRKEVAELKETVKALETQIQLLNRNILLSERAREQ